MFDLRAKLLEKGLISEEQAARVRPQKPKPRPSDNFLDDQRRSDVADLLARSRQERYAIIRRWVERNRLDKGSALSEGCEKFFLPCHGDRVSWLTLKKEVIDAIKEGRAGVISYMGNHGMAHAVVPREIAEDVGQVFADWLKVLNSP